MPRLKSRTGKTFVRRRRSVRRIRTRGVRAHVSRRIRSKRRGGSSRFFRNLLKKTRVTVHNKQPRVVTEHSVSQLTNTTRVDAATRIQSLWLRNRNFLLRKRFLKKMCHWFMNIISIIIQRTQHSEPGQKIFEEIQKLTNGMPRMEQSLSAADSTPQRRISHVAQVSNMLKNLSEQTYSGLSSQLDESASDFNDSQMSKVLDIFTKISELSELESNMVIDTLHQNISRFMAKIYPFTIVNMTALVLESSKTTGSELTEYYRKQRISGYNSYIKKHIMNGDITKEINLKTSIFKITDINNSLV